MGKKVDFGDRGTYHTGNILNDMTSKEWIKFTKSWFIHNPAPRKVDELAHPAKYPESMVKGFVEFFTKKGQVVLDPFLGTGSTLIACHESGRRGIGIELMKKYADIALSRIKGAKGQRKLQFNASGFVEHDHRVIQGDARNITTIWKEEKLPKIDFVITSPPYGFMLNKTGLAQAKREGLDTTYSCEKADLGNIENYDTFVKELVNIFVPLRDIVNKKKYLVVILQNYIDQSEYKTLAWDFAKEMSNYFTLKGERIWAQDNKTLYPYGYRYSFVLNVHHHYCLIFQNDKHTD